MDGNGKLKHEDSKIRTTVVRHKWKDLTIRVVCDINEHPVTFRNFPVTVLKIFSMLVLVIVFLVCGTLNTILFKLQNESYAKGLGNSPPKLYKAPFVQGVQNFLGKFIICLPLHWIIHYTNPCLGIRDKVFPMKVDEGSNTGKNPKKKLNELLIIFPTIFDVIGSTLLYTGLLFTYASVYQMLKGSVVVFTGVMSIIFLKSDLYKYPHKTTGILLIFIGTLIVGYSSISHHSNSSISPESALLGALFVILANFMRSCQYVFDELFLKRYHGTDPLQIPGYEGFWGLPIQISILFLLYFIPGSDFGSAESFPNSVGMVLRDSELLFFMILITFTLGIHNFSGNWITRELSAASRTTIDCIRNLNIWVFQLIRGKEQFSWVQMLGFVVMVIGTFMYNQVGFQIFCPGCYFRWMRKMRDCRWSDCLWLRKSKDRENDQMMQMEEYGEASN